ncbi:hypothetical protein [Allomesorhizobium camelthorni]|uniref:Uncharacterized protein n=1 Tax=Allomesorhizobium camelthorni TaxID=475069 RepID=A0A6G4WA13_9HYPH|nr:hypothetical protein [Mesorhizobium camelthorni]NGO51076.1 hypothetical protein [Mesorhizobium camelthorni]
MRFRLEGDIVDGDVERVREAVAKAGVEPGAHAVFSLSSPGGSYSVGLDLALLFRRMGFATLVEADAGCYSACAIAFLGGSETLRDPLPTSDPEAIPDLSPDRSMEAGAKIGFHAPYLQLPENQYDAGMVQAAYAVAVYSISRLVEIADRLDVTPAELPRLLAPDPDDFFMADTVDAVRMLDIGYTDYTLQFRDLLSITPAMVQNMCINRWYHLQRRSAYPGYGIAIEVTEEFKEGSRLLGNGEEEYSFAVRRVNQGTASSWIAVMPITKTPDGRNFVWCIFDSAIDSPRVFYRPAGTLSELLEPLEAKNDIWDLAFSEGNIEFDQSDNWSRVMDMAPADTRLDDVADVILSYQVEQEGLGKAGN